MDQSKTLETFASLGLSLGNISSNITNNKFTPKIQEAINNNGWFTFETIKKSLESLSFALQINKIQAWLQAYQFPTNPTNKTIGLVLAGNIPLVGFHDILCCLVCGYNVLAKLSSKDRILYNIIKDLLIEQDSSFKNRLTFTDNNLKNIDAIIATGSDNSARYFEYYFSKYPHIIRRNRNSVAILNGSENEKDYKELGEDIFCYFGLGCRNVSQIWIPENYNLESFFDGIKNYNKITDHVKYANNYDYQKAILLMNLIPIYDNGFVILKEDNSLSSPIGVLHYQYYTSQKQLNEFMALNKHKIQCIVSKTNRTFKTYRLGEAQNPELFDYADNTDTINFLLNLK